jgi:hypothetical protein
MIKVDENALICDLAETYQIYDYRSMPPSQVAIFASGLNANSRIMMKLSKAKAPTDIILLAGIVDRLGLLVWSKTKDAQKGKNQPKSILSGLYASNEFNDVSAFTSGKDFEKERQRIINKMKGGN